MKRFGHLIRHYRMAHGVTLDDLARRIKRSKTALHKMETDKQMIPVDLLPKIAAETGIPPAKLRPDLAKLMEAGG
jgi:transcriptional regulator with XRE-family HTH domain